MYMACVGLVLIILTMKNRRKFLKGSGEGCNKQFLDHLQILKILLQYLCK